MSDVATALGFVTAAILIAALLNFFGLLFIDSELRKIREGMNGESEAGRFTGHGESEDEGPA